MYKNLSEAQKNSFHIYNIYNLLEVCRSHRLPLSVHSTSILFYRKLFEVDKEGVYDFRLLLKAIVLLACKCENVHGDFLFLTRRLKDDEKKMVCTYEGMLGHTLLFEFHIPSPYLRILGYIVVLQERGLIDVKSGTVDAHNPELKTFDMRFYEYSGNDMDCERGMEIESVDKLWETSIINMDKILIVENYHKMNVKECALAALVLPITLYKELIDTIDLERVEMIRKRAKNVKMPTKNELIDIFATLDKNIE